MLSRGIGSDGAGFVGFITRCTEYLEIKNITTKKGSLRGKMYITQFGNQITEFGMVGQSLFVPETRQPQRT